MTAVALAVAGRFVPFVGLIRALLGVTAIPFGAYGDAAASGYGQAFAKAFVAGLHSRVATEVVSYLPPLSLVAMLWLTGAVPGVAPVIDWATKASFAVAAEAVRGEVAWQALLMVAAMTVAATMWRETTRRRWRDAVPLYAGVIAAAYIARTAVQALFWALMGTS
jgi:hypothetical protein